MRKLLRKGKSQSQKIVRNQLNLSDGGKVAFVKENGRYYVANPTMIAFKEIQEEFRGEAERLGLKDVDDVVDLVKEVRAKKRAKRGDNK